MINSIDKTVAQRLTWQYIVALSIVAILTIFGHTLIQISLSDSADNSHVINLAGRQRMLSQKLVKLTLLRTTFDSSWTDIQQDDFDLSLLEWEKTHEGLRDNNLFDNKKYQVENSTNINRMFVTLKPPFEKMKEYYSYIKSGKALSNNMISELLQNEKEFLDTMDNIVFEYDHEATQKVGNLRAFEFLILFLTLFTLLIEFFFIFKPLATYVKGVIQKISNSETKLKQTNSQLLVSNKMLLSTQNNLAKATKETYENKRKKDIVRSAYLLEGQETERNRMSREIHDGLGQMLTGIKLSLGRLKSPDMNPKFKKAFEHMNQLINETIEASRNISFSLMPTALNDFGISSALNIFAKQAEIGNILTLSVQVDNPESRYVPTTEINIYRIVQEAINNIIKHAEATKAKVKLEEINGLLELSITDNGKGFNPELINSNRKSLIHNGLENMKTRVSLLNGSFKLTTLVGEGTDIFIKLPLEAA